MNNSQTTKTRITTKYGVELENEHYYIQFNGDNQYTSKVKEILKVDNDYIDGFVDMTEELEHELIAYVDYCDLSRDKHNE